MAAVVLTCLMALPAGAALGGHAGSFALPHAPPRAEVGVRGGAVHANGLSVLPTGRSELSSATTAARPGTLFQPGSVSETLDLRNGSLLSGNTPLPGNGAGPDAVIVDPGTERVFVANAYAEEVTVLNSSNNTFLGTFPIPGIPTAFALNTAQNQLMVLSRPGGGTPLGYVTYVNASTGKALGATPFNGTATAMVFDPQSSVLYVADAAHNLVIVINATSYAIVTSVPAGSYPRALALDSANHTLYVADNVTVGNLTLINTSSESIQGTISVGANPHALVLLTGSSELFVADFGADKLVIVDVVTNLVVGSVALAAAPQALTADPSDGYVYVDNSSTNTLDVVNSHGPNVVVTVVIGEAPNGMFYDSATNQVYVTETDSDNMTLVSAATQVPDGAVLFGLAPTAMAYDSVSNELGVVVSDQDALWLLNATTEQRVAVIHVGSSPDAVTWDSVNYCFYVANFNSNSVTIVNGSTNQRVITVPVGNEPDGLAFAANYDYIYVENAAFSATFEYTVTEISGATNAVVGTLNVGTQGDLQGIAFDPTSGDLYIGAWNNVTVYNPLAKLVVGTIHLTAIGDDILFVPTLNEVLVAGVFDANFGNSYNLTVIDGTTNNVSGTIRIANGTEGLDYDAENGVLYVSNPFDNTVGAVDLHTGVEVANLTVGWYPGPIADDGAGGQVFVGEPNNASISILSLPGLGEYPVNFTEQGLPTGHAWSVTLGGKTTTSTASWMLLVAPIGTVPFQVGPIPGYAPKPGSGNLTVTDQFQSQLIQFVRLPPTYPVQFEETGLPSGTNWTVDCNSSALNSTFGTITFQARNGTVSFTVPSVAGYSASPSSGTVTITGAPTVQNISFAPISSGTGKSGSGIQLGAVEGYAAAAIAAAVGGVAGAVVARRTGRPGFPGSDPSSG